MSVISRYRWRISIPLALTLLALIFSLVFALASRNPTHAATSVPLVQISHDIYTNPTSQHKTEVEPDTFAFGNTVVSAYQVGRFWNGGSSNIGFSTSTDGGKTFTHGYLPSLTVFSSPPGPYDRASDPSVAFDAKHKVWMISSLGIHTAGSPPGPTVVDLIVSRSTDGGLTWGSPTVVAPGGFLDKNWTVCDDTRTSRFYGNCYTEFDNPLDGDRILMSTSSDGGLTWGPPLMTANKNFGIGGQPLVRPDGRVIVPIIGFTVAPAQPFKMMSFISTNGGVSWSSTFSISEIDFHIPQGLRATIPLPSAEIDASGKVYVVWADCRFEKGCPANDFVLSTSTNGVQWSAAKRIPIEPVGKNIDFLIPGLAVDRTTADGSAHLALTFYYYPIANCQTADCLLEVGFVSSRNGGASWSDKKQIAGPMLLQWLALTTQGYMVGDYLSTSIVPGDDDATPVFAVASPPTGNPPRGGTCIATGEICHEAMFTTPEDLLAVTGGTNIAGNDPTYPAPPWKGPVAHTAY